MGKNDLIERYIYAVTKHMKTAMQKDVAKELGISVLGKLPMDQKFAKAADAGQIFAVENDYLTEAKTVLEKL